MITNLALAITLLCGQLFAPCEPSCADDNICINGKAAGETAGVCASPCKTDADCPALAGYEVQCRDACVVECYEPDDCPEGMVCADVGDEAGVCGWLPLD